MAERGQIRVTFGETLHILAPYVSSKFLEQVVAVLPIVIYLAAVQVLLFRQDIAGGWGIALAILVAVAGLMFFMEGLRLGLMPLGQTLGASLPLKCRFSVVLIFSFIVGILATLAEPAIGILKSAGAGISSREAPLLAYLLGPGVGLLVVAVGVGVGIATTMGIVRLLKGHSLAPYIYPAVALAGFLTFLAYSNPVTAPLIGLAWDCGAVTTGPVTVPLVLALGIGVARSAGRGDSGMAGFGVVTLASLFPVIAVLGLGFLQFARGIHLQEVAASVAAGSPGWWENPMILPLFQAGQAVLPLVVFLYLFQRFIVRGRIENPGVVLIGVVFATFGLALFNMGLAEGLIPLGTSMGGAVPRSFYPPDASLFGPQWGAIVAIGVAFLLGYGATLAEPALNALGGQVEEITVGAFKKPLLMHAVAFGVGVGISLGVAKFIFGFDLIKFLLVPYAFLLVLTFLSKEEFVNIGWDSAGVTTGPVTVPLVIAMGLGIGGVVGQPDSFGILALASIFPIMSVLSLGLLVRGRKKKEA